jgi:hypothetical protein
LQALQQLIAVPKIPLQQSITVVHTSILPDTSTCGLVEHLQTSRSCTTHLQHLQKRVLSNLHMNSMYNMNLQWHTFLLFPFPTIPLHLPQVLSGIYTKFVPSSRHIRMIMKARFPCKSHLPNHHWVFMPSSNPLRPLLHHSAPPESGQHVITCMSTEKGGLYSIEVLSFLIYITFAESFSPESHRYVLPHCCHSITCTELHPDRRWVGRRTKSMLPNEQIIVQCKA